MIKQKQTISSISPAAKKITPEEGLCSNSVSAAMQMVISNSKKKGLCCSCANLSFLNFMEFIFTSNSAKLLMKQLLLQVYSTHTRAILVILVFLKGKGYKYFSKLGLKYNLYWKHCLSR